VNKKGDLGWEEIAKIILVIVFLIILVLFATIYREKGLEIINNMKEFIRFGR